MVELQDNGAAFQVGLGANGKATAFGASGQLSYSLVAQPDNTTLPVNGEGTLTLQECAFPSVADPIDSCAAMRVVSYEPGPSATASQPLTERADPTAALGIPENEDGFNFVSLGYGGSIVLDFETRLLNLSGDDLILYNTTFAGKSCEQYPERARVLVSRFGNDWVDIGSVCQDGSLEIGTLSWVRYIRIEDVSDQGAFFNGDVSDGYDLDAIVTPVCGRVLGISTGGRAAKTP